MFPPRSLPEANPFAVRALALAGAECGVAPADRWVLHLATPASSADELEGSARGDLAGAVSCLTESGGDGGADGDAGGGSGDGAMRPSALAAVYFRQWVDTVPDDALPANVAALAGPDASVGLDWVVADADAAARRALGLPGLFQEDPRAGAAGKDPAGCPDEEEDADTRLLAVADGLA